MSYVFGRHVFRSKKGEYLCQLCKTWFSSEAAILVHCRDFTIHKWCEQCKRVFPTEVAKQQHLLNSSTHHICYFCDNSPDFGNENDLFDHEHEIHKLCYDCFTPFHTDEKLHEHLASAHRHTTCTTCWESFDNKNGLRQHMKTHEPKNIKCPACDRTFSRRSHALLHLERSKCSSIKEVNKLALKFEDESNQEFIDQHSSFFCVHCEYCFDPLSRLFSHIEDSRACGHLLQQPDSMPEALFNIWDKIV